MLRVTFFVRQFGEKILIYFSPTNRYNSNVASDSDMRPWAADMNRQGSLCGIRGGTDRDQEIVKLLRIWRC